MRLFIHTRTVRQTDGFGGTELRSGGATGHGAAGRHAAGGFTLIEVLITLVILSVGIVAVLKTFNNALGALEQSRDCLRANHLIREKFCDLESAASAGGGAPESARGQTVWTGCEYQWECTVEPLPLPSPAGTATGTCTLAEVTVTVWRGGSTRRYAATTYVRSGSSARGP